MSAATEKRAETLNGLHSRYRIDSKVFAHGGRAVLYNVMDSPHPLVYKAFKQPLDSADRARLGRLVSEGRNQFVTAGRSLGNGPGAAMNWPVDMVMEEDTIRGVLLPRVPLSYVRSSGSLRSMEFLILHRGDGASAAQRVSILIRLAEVMTWLADRKLVHGDVSPRNVLWTGQPSPEVIVLDVDGVHDAVTAATEHVATPGWTDPRILERITNRHDLYSDRYALGLFMYRGLLVTPGMLRKGPNGWQRPSLPPGLPTRLRGLLLRCLDQPLAAEQRPHPSEWVDALLGEFFPSSSPNWLAFRRLEEFTELRQAQDRTVSGRPPIEARTIGGAGPRPVTATGAKPGRLRRWFAQRW